MNFLCRQIPLRCASKIRMNNQQCGLLQARHACYTWPIGNKPKLRETDIQEQARVTKILLHLLRTTTGHEHGLRTRPDGSLSVKELLNYPVFRGMNMVQLQEIVAKDPKYRFHLIFDPTRGGEAWWIRAKLWDELHYVFQPLRLSSGTKFGVYKTTLENWENQICRTGISCQNDEYIRLDQHVPNSDYMADYHDQAEVFIYLNIPQCMYAGIRFFHQISTSETPTSKSPIYTKGNTLGLIPPDLFLRAQLVEARKTHLWGPRNPQTKTGWAVEQLDYDEHGRRRTMLPLLPYNIHGFVDLVKFKKPDESFVHPDTVREAETVL